MWLNTQAEHGISYALYKHVELNQINGVSRFEMSQKKNLNTINNIKLSRYPLSFCKITFQDEISNELHESIFKAGSPYSGVIPVCLDRVGWRPIHNL